MGLMEVIYTAVLALGTACLALSEKNSTNEEPQYIVYHDVEYDVTRVINLKETLEASLLHISMSTSTMYLLYTRINPVISQRLIMNSDISIKESNYNPMDQTVVIVHGWGGNQNSQLNPAIRDAYLGVMDANIIVVDWSEVATSNYVTATLGAPLVGWALGRFLDYLNKVVGASYDTMHLIGFSLGAHVVGNAGRFLEGKVARITGLDPAGPLWGPLNKKRLKATDAKYVEAIHTNRKLLGTLLRSGDVDFYPNGGSSQPGCASMDSCSHNMSWKLFAATVKYDHLIGHKCTGEIAMTMNVCNGDSLHMGNDDLLKNKSGQYRLNTEDQYPYKQKK